MLKKPSPAVARGRARQAKERDGTGDRHLDVEIGVVALVKQGDAVLRPLHR
jgi:hypothetical protein